MPAFAVLDRPVRLGCRVTGALSFLPPLLTRLVLGMAFYLAGRGKLADPEGVVEQFTMWGIPQPELSVASVSRLEYYGGMLLIAGLLTRIVALLLSSTMVVALLTADRAVFLETLRGASEAGLTDVPAFVFLLFMVWLVVYGPGVVSADHFLFRRWEPKSGQTA